MIDNLARMFARRVAKRLSVGAFAIALIACGAETSFGTVFKTLNAPGSSSTNLWGISGNLVVGDGDNGSGFVYNNQTTAFTYYSDPLEDPNVAVNGYGTVAYGVSGNEVVGAYYDSSEIVHGFLYNGSTYKTLDAPNANKTIRFQGTVALGISGSTVFGQYNDPTGFGGFLYDGTSFTNINYPGASNTFITGISGNKIVGWYSPAGAVAVEGFIYNGSTFTTLDDPLALAAGANGQTLITGISGQNIVGYYTTDGGNTSHGFWYNGSTFTTIDDPLAPNQTQINGISGNLIVGTYNSSGANGFIAAIPEPSSLLLMAAGGFVICGIVMMQRSRTSKEITGCRSI